jgi:predicted AAA+ superfamily ATPase
MWSRLCGSNLVDMWKRYPAILLLGARQVGKTTLARHTFPHLPYCDLEDFETRRLFMAEPAFQIRSREQGGLILDEAQLAPEVFQALRGAIDGERNRYGRFLILGSAQPTLIRHASESLTGRLGTLDLDPLTAAEVHRGTPPLDWRQLWLAGGFPGAQIHPGGFREWWEAYLRLFLERDLPQYGVGADPILLRRLLTMLAHQQGGLFNASQLGASLGLSHHTVRRYVEILEQTFMVRRLTPYFRNVGKRLIKSPKLYLRDSGLLHHLLNISSPAELENHPSKGASWEGFVLEDLLRRERLAQPFSQAYFWRTADGAEIDLLIDRGGVLWGVEIKAGSGRDPDAANRLAKALPECGARAAWIISQAPGVEGIQPAIERRGFESALNWLPG